MISDLDVYGKYNANGVTTTFAIAHAITSDNTLTPENEVEVYTVDEATDPDVPVETLKVHVTDYTIVGANVVFGTAPANGLKVYVGRKIDLTQAVDLDVNSEYPAAATEEGLDRIVAMIQLLARQIARAPKFRKTFSALVDLQWPEPPTDAAQRAVIWNADGDALENGPTAGEIETAEASAELAEDWATKIDGSVDGSDYSSKAWAIGGVGVTDTASRGAAKEWAIETSGTVDGTNYSSKEWAHGTQTRGVASAGSSKDWANYTGGTVDDVEFSAKHYSQLAEAAADAAATAVQALAFRDVVYVDDGDSPVALTDASSGILYVADTTAGNIVFTFPQISTLTLTAPWTVGIQKAAAANTITCNRTGTDVFGAAATSDTLVNLGQSKVFIPDTDNVPDQWNVLEFGPSATDVTATNAFGTDNLLLRADGAGRGAQSSGVTLSDLDAMTGLTAVTVDNLNLDGNTISSTDANGNIELEPNGTGLVRSTKKTAFTAAMAIGQNSAAAASALVEMVSTTQGLLPPRMTEAQRDLIGTPAEGLVIFNTDDDELNVYAGGAWTAVGGAAPTAPKITKYTSGTGTHNFTGSPLYVRVRMCGGGGGGGASGNSLVGGGNGGQTTFGTSLLVCEGGNGGVGGSGDGGAGGTTDLGTGPTGIAMPGGRGQGGSSGASDEGGANGGSNGFGIFGPGAAIATGTNAVVANCGCGGGGASSGSVNGAGGGGGAGGYIDAIISGATLSGMGGSAAYAVGAAGSAGTGSSFNGAAGSAGVIIVTEYYQ